jgi:hypothetical protein
LDVSYDRVAVQSVKAFDSTRVLVSFRLLDNCGLASSMAMLKAREQSLVGGNSRFAAMSVEYSPVSESDNLDEADDHLEIQLESRDSDLFRGVVTSGVETQSASDSSKSSTLTYVMAAAAVLALAVLGFGVCFWVFKQKRAATKNVSNLSSSMATAL